jgi:hypothetical protein
VSIHVVASGYENSKPGASVSYTVPPRARP